MAKSSSFFRLSICSLLVLLHFHGSVNGQLPQQGTQQVPCRSQCLCECQVGSLEALEPTHRVEAEAGVTEHWDENNEQFQCAGVAATRHTIQPKGLLLPSFANAPKLVYIVQGGGINGAVIPGCPETYQSFQQSQQQQCQQCHQIRDDRHQKIRKVHKEDIVAVPAGVTHWFYNHGEEPLIMVTLLDTSNNDNQLDATPRTFNLAGKPRRQGEQDNYSNNIFRGFKAETLAEAFSISVEMARRLQGQDDNRGDIVLVKNGLQLISPISMEEEDGERQQLVANGIEEMYCNMRLRHNIGNPELPDTYNPRAGRISRINSHKLPILNYLQLNAERGVLFKNALTVPHWNLNAHSVIYVTKGSARIEIVGNYQQPVYDGELREGQMLIIPQTFVVTKKAKENGFQWIAFKTNDNAITSSLAGDASIFRGLPLDVLTNAYRISDKEAMKLKYNRKS